MQQGLALSRVGMWKHPQPQVLLDIALRGGLLAITGNLLRPPHSIANVSSNREDRQAGITVPLPRGSNHQARSLSDILSLTLSRPAHESMREAVHRDDNGCHWLSSMPEQPPCSKHPRMDAANFSGSLNRGAAGSGRSLAFLQRTLASAQDL